MNWLPLVIIKKNLSFCESNGNSVISEPNLMGFSILESYLTNLFKYVNTIFISFTEDVEGGGGATRVGFLLGHPVDEHTDYQNVSHEMKAKRRTAKEKIVKAL